MIRNLIFDVGGVLHIIEYEKIHDTIARLKGVPTDRVKEAYWNHIHDYDRGSLTPEEFVATFSEDAGISIETEEYFSIFLQNSHLNRNLLKLIKDTLSKRFSIFILSNNSVRNTEFFKKNSGLGGLVKAEFYSMDYGTIKPEGRFFQLFLEKTGISPEVSVFIDDLKKNLETAIRFGIKTILFQKNEQLISDLKKLTPF